MLTKQLSWNKKTVIGWRTLSLRSWDQEGATKIQGTVISHLDEMKSIEGRSIVLDTRGQTQRGNDRSLDVRWHDFRVYLLSTRLSVQSAYLIGGTGWVEKFPEGDTRSLMEDNACPTFLICDSLGKFWHNGNNDNIPRRPRKHSHTMNSDCLRQRWWLLLSSAWYRLWNFWDRPRTLSSVHRFLTFQRTALW